MTVKFTKLKKVKSPSRGTPKSAGIDFYVPDEFRPITLDPGMDVLIPSGIKVRLPEGYALVANNKSGVATKKNLVFGASVVDEDYTGELHLHLINVGNKTVSVEPGDKIIQFLLEKQEYADVEEVSTEEELYADFQTERGAGGFGSTGSK